MHYNFTNTDLVTKLNSHSYTHTSTFVKNNYCMSTKSVVTNHYTLMTSYKCITGKVSMKKIYCRILPVIGLVSCLLAEERRPIVL